MCRLSKEKMVLFLVVSIFSENEARSDILGQEVKEDYGERKRHGIVISESKKTSFLQENR